MNGISDISESEAVLIDYWYERFEPDLGLHSNFLHNELWEIDYDAYVQGTLYSEKSFRNPSTNESETCYLIGEEKSQKKENGKINFQRVYTSQFSDIVHGGSTAFTPKNWDGLNSTHANGGKVYGVSFDSKKYSYFTGRKEIKSIGEVTSKTSTTGTERIISPNGTLIVNYASDRSFELDCSLPAEAIRTAIQLQSGHVVQVSKYANVIEIQGVGIEDYLQSSVENMTTETPVEFTFATGVLKIAWVTSSSTIQGLIKLFGDAIINDGLQNQNLQGSLSFTAHDDHTEQHFTLTDISSLSAIKSDFEAKFGVAVNVSYLNEVGGSWPTDSVGIFIEAQEATIGSDWGYVNDVTSSGLNQTGVELVLYNSGSLVTPDN